MNKKGLHERSEFIMSEEVFSRIREGLRLRKPLGYRSLLRASQSGQRIGIVRVGENLYIAGDEGAVTNWVDPSTFESLEDVIYENQGLGIEANEIEEIELDEIELNTAEDTPLLEAETSFSATSALAETGGISGAAAAAAPSTSAVITGVAIVGTAITIGTTVGVLSTRKSDSDHQDPVVSIPDHRFIGPGNTVSDADPVDRDDEISKNHDINYERARTQEDIVRADDTAISEFASDFVNTGNIHSAIGAAGIGGKRVIESVIGVQYPPNLPTSSVSGMSPAHSRSIRALGKYPVHRDPSRHDDFPTDRNRQRYVWDAWNRARQNQGLPRVDPPPRLNIAVTARPPINRRTGVRPDNASISFRDWKAQRRGQAGPLIDGFNRQREQQDNRNDHLFNTVVAAELRDDERLEVEAIIREVNGGSISIADFDNFDGAGPSNEPMDTRGNKRQHDGGQGGSGAPPNPAEAVSTASASGTGKNSGSDGGFDSAQGPKSFLPTGGYSAQGGMMRFTKVHRMKSWACPYFSLTTDVPYSGSNLVTTPLAKIPWEYAFFYMSPEEFSLLPAGSYIDSCHIKIMQTVASTAFPTGATTSTVATTNHPKVLCIGKDLEKKARGGVDKVLEFTTDMVPSLKTTPGIENLYTDFIEKQYGTDQTAADGAVIVPGAGHKIPFYNFGHFCIYQPNKAQAAARGFTAATAPGFEYFQNYITELNSNDTTWDDVDSMSYKFQSAPIGQQFKQLEILTEDIVQSTGNAVYYNAKRNVTNVKPNGNTTFTESMVPSNANSVPVVTYSSAPMEKGSYFVRGDAANKPSRQPTFHIGMRAIDKNDPTVGSSRASTFVQANIEFEITATLVVNLPSYPNRFMRPKFYNTSIENTVQGIGAYPAFDSNNKNVTFGIYNESATAPAVVAVDQIRNEPTEGSLVNPGRQMRPRRDVPHIVPTIKRKDNEEIN